MEALLKTLERGNDVRITYETVNSKRQEEIEGTLRGVSFKQYPKSDTLVVRNINTNQFEDIRVSTIITWMIIDLENAK